MKPRARPAFRPACTARPWRPNSSRTAIPCGIIPSRSSSRLWAAGSPPVRVGILPRCTPILTIWSSPPESSPRAVLSPRAACQGRAPALARIACLSARRAFWALSPRPGCACSIDRSTGRQPRCTLKSLRMELRPFVCSVSRACTPPTVVFSIRPRSNGTTWVTARTAACSCSALNPRTIHSNPGSTARLSAVRIWAARRPTGW